MSPELRLAELRLAEIHLRSEAQALGNLHGLTLAERQRIVRSFQRALRQLRERQALERQEGRLENVIRFFVGRHYGGYGGHDGHGEYSGGVGGNDAHGVA